MLRRLRDGKTCRVPKRTRAADAIAANPQMSNVAIADEIGVDEKTVRKARPASDKSEPDERVGRDGKTYTVPKRTRAADAIAANLQKSDRAIAEELGISDTTVQRARNNSGASDEAPVDMSTPERVGRDGKTYRVPKRTCAADAIAANPE